MRGIFIFACAIRALDTRPRKWILLFIRVLVGTELYSPPKILKIIPVSDLGSALSKRRGALTGTKLGPSIMSAVRQSQVRAMTYGAEALDRQSRQFLSKRQR